MKTLNLNEAAAFLHLHPHTLEAKARAGEVPGAKPGKCWVFIDVDLADWLREQYRETKTQGDDLQRSARVFASTGVNGQSAKKRLEKLLATKLPKRKTQP
jgi:hypothetical protein